MEQGQKEGQIKETKGNKKSDWETITGIAAAPIFLHDRIQNAIDRMVIYVWRTLVAELHDARVRYKHSSRAIMLSLFSLAVVTCALLLVFDHFTTYEYSYNGRILGYVRSQDTVVDLLEVAGERLSESTKTDIVFTPNDNITFRLVSSDKKDNDTADQVLNKLTYMTDIEVTATGIYYGDELVAIVENDAVAQTLIEGVLKMHGTADEGMVVRSAEFLKPVTTNQLEVMLVSLKSRAQAMKLMLEGGEHNIYHIVKTEETVDSLADAYNVSADEIYIKGRTYPTKTVIPGEIVRMKKTAEPVVVRMEERGTTSEIMRYDREVVDTDELYIGDTEVAQVGADGLKRVSGTIVKENGVEIERDITKTEIVKPPVTEIVLRGTREKPKTAPTGRFEMPIKDGYSLTSEFGPRWGGWHNGMDFACPTGTPIYAADGGKVIRASWYSSYGNCIEIEHENGTYTRYAHLSDYDVSVGDAVYQGQLIGRVGNTGWSTGSHLHFEIHPNGGDPVNPAPHLGLD